MSAREKLLKVRFAELQVKGALIAFQGHPALFAIPDGAEPQPTNISSFILLRRGLRCHLASLRTS